MILGATAIVGLASLVGFSLLNPGGRVVLVIVAATLALATLLVVSCLSGHAAASVVNFVRLQFGRAGLELTHRRHRQHHHRG
jgi:hypothetical protein